MSVWAQLLERVLSWPPEMSALGLVALGFAYRDWQSGRLVRRLYEREYRRIRADAKVAASFADRTQSALLGREVRSVPPPGLPDELPARASTMTREVNLAKARGELRAHYARAEVAVDAVLQRTSDLPAPPEPTDPHAARTSDLPPYSR